VGILEDSLLLYRLRHGDGEALRRVYEKYKGAMVSVAMSMTGQMATAEDVTQEAFVAFAEKAAAGAVRRNLKAYLMTCVVNGIRCRARKKSSHERHLVEGMELPAQGLGVVERVIAQEDIERVRMALVRLPEEQREVVTLRIHGQMKFDEIAAMQDSNANTARTRYSRGLERLRQLMDGKVGA